MRRKKKRGRVVVVVRSYGSYGESLKVLLCLACYWKWNLRDVEETLFRVVGVVLVGFERRRVFKTCGEEVGECTGLRYNYR